MFKKSKTERYKDNRSFRFRYTNIIKLKNLIIFIIVLLSSVYSSAFSQTASDSLQAEVQYRKAEKFVTARIYDSAVFCYEAAWKYFSTSTVWERKAKIMSRFCGIMYKTGNYGIAQAYGDTALIILKESGADTLHHLYSSVYHDLGTMQHIQGNFKKAKYYYLKAIKIRENEEDISKSGINKTYNNLGLCFIRLHDINNAIIYLKKCLSFVLKYNSDDDYTIGQAYNNIGAAYSEILDLKSAENYYLKALEYYKKVTEEPDFALGDVYLNLAKVADNDSNFVKSIQLKRRAIYNYIISGKTHRNLPMVYFNLSVTYKMMGEYDSAMYYIEKSKNLYIDKFGAKHPEVAHIYNFYGRIYYAQGEYDNALRYFQKSLIANVVNFNDTVITTNPELSSVLSGFYLAGGVIWKASTFREKYLQTGNIDYQKLALENYFLFDRIADMMFFDFDNDGSRFQLINDFYENYIEAMRVAYELYNATGDPGYAEDAFFFSEKCKSSLLTAGINETNAKLFADIPDSLLAYEEEYRSKISFFENEQNELLLYSPEDSASLLAVNDSLFFFNERLNRLTTFFEKEYPAYYALKYNRKPVSFEFIRKKLIAGNGALVEYLLTDTSLFIIALSDNNVRFVSEPLDSSFAGKLDNFIKSTTDYDYITGQPEESQKDFIQSSEYLFNSLFPSAIYDLIKDKTQLCIVPDSKLDFISFDALITNKPKGKDYATFPYLLNRHIIRYSYAASLLQNDIKKKKTENIYAGFAPSYDVKLLAQTEELKDFPKFRSNITPLKGNKTEVENANSIFNGTAFYANEATEANFKKNATKYSILHLAMHALVDDKNPLNSRLIFSQTNGTSEDNFLNTYEIYNLPLNADIAILSACNTSNGILDEGEGVLSLSRAFKYAGVNSIVSSLWPAHDESSKTIMIGFFNGLKDKLPLDKALRNSKMEFVANADPIHSHPYYWANFILTGDNKPLDISEPWYKQKVFLFSLLGFFLLVVLFLVRRKSGLTS